VSDDEISDSYETETTMPAPIKAFARN